MSGLQALCEGVSYVTGITVLVRKEELFLFRHSLYTTTLCSGILCLSSPVSPLGRVIPRGDYQPCIAQDLAQQ